MARIIKEFFTYCNYLRLQNKNCMISSGDTLSLSVPLIYHRGNHIPEEIPPENFENITSKNIQTEFSYSDCTIVDYETQKIPINKEYLYIFIFDEINSKMKIVKKFENYFFNEKFTILLIERSNLKLLFKNRNLEKPNNTLKFKIQEYENIFLNINYMFFYLFVILAVNYLCFKIIKSQAHKDPLYENFVIPTANIKKFKDVKHMSENTCLICFDEYDLNEDVRLLDCEHFFHPACIDRWLIGHSRCCPYCRKDILVDEKI